MQVHFEVQLAIDEPESLCSMVLPGNNLRVVVTRFTATAHVCLWLT